MKPFLTLHDPAAAQAYYQQGLWTADTMQGLLARHATERPDAWALRDATRRLTWRQLADWVDALADHLAGHGIRPGDRVSLWLSNRVETVALLLACARQGYACNPSLHRNYTVDEIAGLMGRIRTALLVAEAGWGADAADHDLGSAFASLPDLKAVLTLPAVRGQPGDLPPIGATGSPGPAADNPDQVFYLAFTSGTTGVPKCVMHSHNSLMANARDMVRDWGHGPDSVVFSLSPLSHHIAWVALAQALTCGAELVVDDQPDGVGKLDWVIETGATYIMGVPTHAMDMLSEMQARGIERLGRVGTFYMAGSPIPPSVCEAFLAQGITPQNVYGMTENSSHQYTQPDDDQATIVESCGRGGGAYTVRIFDREDADRAVPTGTVGQIGGRGACLMLGYFDNQTATEDSFNRDGWFLSGDLGMLDQAGNLRITGRLKDMIIRGGHNIYPARIEDLAVKHACIDKAAAFGIADDRLGEKVCLGVLASDPAPTADQILAHLHASGLSKYDMPEYFIRLDDFPLTASGKILKRELADWARSGRISPAPCRWVEPD